MKGYVRGAVLGWFAGAVLVATTAASVLPAVAGEDDPWPARATCATGAFTGHTVHPPDFQGPYLELTGWAQQCVDEKDPAPPPAEFGFAYYGPPEKGVPAGVVYERRLRAFGPGAEPTAFSGRFDLSGTGARQAGSPICLMRDPDTRIACVDVRMIAAGMRPSFEVTPLATDDPRVVGPVIVQPSGSDPHTSCGTCL